MCRLGPAELDAEIELLEARLRVAEADLGEVRWNLEMFRAFSAVPAARSGSRA